MASPTRSNVSPTVSRLTGNIPNTTVISPRSISTRSQLEESISTLQSKIYQMPFFFFRLWLIRDTTDRCACASVRERKRMSFFFDFIST